ncbi:hypothetical protein [Paenibacillus wulumuqiensis]|uniref:hypothetical protein n=1 Tax=Paenibacillus wulumuqiensis TaxID=1567107 RepID=UPI000619ACCC|nr:hypothetical protein [Paenibacillus wulumuqiensis]
MLSANIQNKGIGDWSGNKHLPIKISIDYSASSSGQLQLFYIFNEWESFNTEKSKTFTVEPNTKGSIEIELPNMPANLQLDTDVHRIVLEKIKITQGLTLINEQKEVWQRKLGYIPMLWATQDKSKYINLPNLSKSIETTKVLWPATNIKSTNQYVYFLMEIDSANQQEVYLDLLNEEKEEVKGGFSFYTSPGKHLYAVLLSTDYKFWTNQVEQIRFSSGTNLKIDKAAYFLPDSQNLFLLTDLDLIA